MVGKESEKTDKIERESAKERRAQEKAGILRTTAPISDKTWYFFNNWHFSQREYKKV